MRTSIAAALSWLAGSAAATATLWAKSGPRAIGLFPAFATILGLWVLIAWPLVRRATRLGNFSVTWLYGGGVVSALFAAALFFALFAYPFMVCVPVGMAVATIVFHAFVRSSAGSKRDPNDEAR